MNFFTIIRMLLLFFSIGMFSSTSFANSDKPVIYLIPGQGSDSRIFKNLQLDTAFEISHMEYGLPDQNMTLKEFAKELSLQIDTTRPYILIGVSLGGMIATEISEFMQPEQVILISSAKSRYELPKSYQFQRSFPIYKIVPGNVAKGGAKVLQPLFEPDRNKEKETCKRMLDDKDPEFLSRTIKMILEWERTDYPEGIIHIHGDNDSTLPIRNVHYDYLIEDGSHMMALTRGEEISILINELLCKK